MSLKPMYKWAGGKRKEIKIFENYFPEFVKNNDTYKYIEPFFGGGAVYWYLCNNDNVINDIDHDMISYLKMIKEQNTQVIETAVDLKAKIDAISLQEKNGELTIKEAKEKRGIYYYHWRNLDRNNGLSSLSEWEKAFRFIFMNQLAFNGMRRFNKKGEFNIPYGNYKSFSNVDLMTNDDHVNLLKNTSINSGDYNDVIVDDDNVFIFLDPPYTRVFKEYTSGNVFGYEEQERLANKLKSLKKAKWMLVINDDEKIREMYDGYVKETYDVKYGTNIKNRFDTSTQHIIITNY